MNASRPKRAGFGSVYSPAWNSPSANDSASGMLSVTAPLEECATGLCM
jgi:hypothetical protein